MTVTLRRSLDDLMDHEFDLLVVGGGIAGACAAWDAALRGLSVALIDAGDFASGASSNSLKLVHGGLRYVKRLTPGAAREAVRERRAWLRIAPHLVTPTPILVPAYRRSVQNRAAVRLLLAANDALAWDRNRGVNEEATIPPARMLSRSEVLALAPALADTALSGGALFHDGQIRNTERLVLEVVRGAAGAGAVVANYVELENGTIERGAFVGALLRDRFSDRTGTVRARSLINAAGAAAPAVLTRLLPVNTLPIPRYSLGVNLMISPRGLNVGIAFNSRERSSRRRRQLLWVPWRDREILGTYHRDHDSRTGQPAVTAGDVATFLDELNRALPSLGLEADDVVLVHGGLLPVDDDGGRGTGLLQRHRIIDHAAHGAAGAVSLISVKFTTARLAAEEAVDLVQQRLGRGASASLTARTPLPAAPASVAALEREALERFGHAIAAEVLHHLVRTHGTNYERVIAHSHEMAAGPGRVHDRSLVIGAELIHGVREEMAQTVDDVLYRRTELGARGVVDPDVIQHVKDVVRREIGMLPEPSTRNPPLPWHGAGVRRP